MAFFDEGDGVVGILMDGHLLAGTVERAVLVVSVFAVSELAASVFAASAFGASDFAVSVFFAFGAALVFGGVLAVVFGADLEILAIFLFLNSYKNR